MNRRIPFVAGNWKMNTDRAGCVRLASEVRAGCAGLAGKVDVAVCPPFVWLESVGNALRGQSDVMLGAQNAYTKTGGAFTGEIAPPMLKELGVAHVIIGHSERRHIMGESDALIREKAHAVLDAGMSLILCIGETIDERRAGSTDAVNERQVRAALEGITAERAARVTIAYEPVWAIGTGVTATPADAQDAHAKIRRVVASMLGAPVAEAMRIQYGGSMKPDNARELLAQPDIDGGLIGGAALKASDFLAIVRAAE